MEYNAGLTTIHPIGYKDDGRRAGVAKTRCRKGCLEDGLPGRRRKIATLPGERLSLPHLVNYHRLVK